MTTPLAPTPAQQAANKIDGILAKLLQRDKQVISTLNSLLNNSKDAAGNAIAAADIISAGGERYAQLQTYITGMKAQVNILAPGSY
jgi:hypothetical protein